jgi:sugar/nucleoside kinase (ribokinase family)
MSRPAIAHATPLDVWCAGIIVADFICEPIATLPASGALMMTPGISWAIGGCASNVAADLARLGLRSAVVGRVGADPAGEFVRNSLNVAGVETSRVLSTPGFQTSATLVVNVRGEDRRFIHTFGANAAFTGEELSPELLPQARVLYLGGLFLMPALTGERVTRLFRAARQAGLTTVLDVVIPDPQGTWPVLQQLLPHVDVFLPNHDEGELITGLSNPLAQAAQFRQAGAETVVITCGREGSVLSTGDQLWRGGIFPVDFVDGTGSGDAFAAGYMSGLLEGQPATECLRLGSALGASCVRQPGATTGVFNRAELETWLRTHTLPLERLA